jgi:hypothetical protein
MACNINNKVSKGPDIPSVRAKGKNSSALNMEAATFSKLFHLYLSTKHHCATTYKIVIPMKLSPVKNHRPTLNKTCLPRHQTGPQAAPMDVSSKFVYKKNLIYLDIPLHHINYRTVIDYCQHNITLQ